MPTASSRLSTNIAFDKKNYKLPKGTDPAALDLDKCREIIKEQDEAPARPRRRYTRRTAK